MFNSSGSGSDVGGQPPPLPMAYGIHVLHGSGYLPNKTHSNTAGKWHWHRRKEQTFHHIVRPGIRHTSGHPTHMALPPPVGVRHKEFQLTHILFSLKRYMSVFRFSLFRKKKRVVWHQVCLRLYPIHCFLLLFTIYQFLIYPYKKLNNSTQIFKVH